MSRNLPLCAFLMDFTLYIFSRDTLAPQQILAVSACQVVFLFLHHTRKCLLMKGTPQQRQNHFVA